MARISSTISGGFNFNAFLDSLAFSEIGYRMLAMTDDGYDVCVGSIPSRLILMPNYSAHPMLRNEQTNSNAAGRYQLMGRYWIPYRDTLKLPDFSPISQDLIALRQIREQGATSLILAGRISEAMYKVNNIWVSLPRGSQARITEQQFLDAYVHAGGAIT